jgi:hypothetical protein
MTVPDPGPREPRVILITTARGRGVDWSRETDAYRSMPQRRGEGMSQQPDGLLPHHTYGAHPTTGLAEHTDQPRPRANVKALRPLRGRPCGSSLDTDSRPTLPANQRDKAKTATKQALTTTGGWACQNLCVSDVARP